MRGEETLSLNNGHSKLKTDYIYLCMVLCEAADPTMVWPEFHTSSAKQVKIQRSVCSTLLHSR